MCGGKFMQILELDPISRFKCDGKKCNSKCCKYWTIDIDDATLSKYKHIKPAAKSKEITKHIKYKQHPTRGKAHLVTLDDKQNCPFLGDDNLCYIQKNYGEDYLSQTCKTYPRMNYKVADDFIYRAMSLTCPIACNLLLNEPRDSKFSAYELSESKIIVTHDISKADRSFMLPLLNVTNHNILRSPDLTLDERLAVVALFTESANDAKNLKELADISETFEKQVLKNARKLLSPITFNSINFLKEILIFINALFNGEGKIETAQIYTKFINETFEISILNDDINKLDFDKIEKIYKEKYLPAKKELFEMNELQIENFAINYLFMTAIPISYRVNDFRKNIAKFLLEYKMAEFIFVCFYASIKENWHKIAIELAVEDIATCFEHNIYVKKAISERFKDLESVMPTIQLLLEV